MTISAILIIAAMLLTAVIAEPISKRLHLPFSALLVFIGFISSELITAAGFDTGLRWHIFGTLVLHILLPVLVFESAFNMQARTLQDNIIPILFLAVPLLLISAGLTGSLLFFGIGHPSGFPWAAALLTGVLLSATDPVAIVSLFKRLGAPERLIALLEGESLLNDATAVVLYILLISILLDANTSDVIPNAIVSFLYTFVGGILIGLLCTLLIWPLYKILNAEQPRSLCSLALAILAFYIAEEKLDVSGIMAVLTAGLFLGEMHRRLNKNNKTTFTNQLWELNAYIANALIFLLVGATITLTMFSSQWLAILIGIAAALFARVLIIYALLPVITLLPQVAKLPLSYQHVMTWGGLRGAATLALALSLPTDIDSWFTIQSIAYGVTLFTLFIQAPTITPLVKRTLK